MVRCDCGNVKPMKNTVLSRGITVSCGCVKGERHGMSGSLIYGVWSAMRQRCSLPGTINQRDYMDRGISVCDEWSNSFNAFHAWAKSSGYKRGLEIDRIDNDAGYSPSNCRWVTRLVNANNKRNTVMVNYRGERMPFMDALRKSKAGVSVATATARIKNGWDVDEALNKPTRKGRYREGRLEANALRHAARGIT